MTTTLCVFTFVGSRLCTKTTVGMQLHTLHAKSNI